MKCPKTLLTAAVVATMVAPMVSTTAFAADVTGTTNSTSASTDVKYEVNQGYTWSIHSEIDFGKDAGTSKTVEKANNTVSVSNNIIPEGKKLQITVKGNNGGSDTASTGNGEFAILSGSNTRLTYTIKSGETNFSSGDSILDVNAGTNTDSKALTFTLSTTTGAAEVAGSYTGKVIYTANIVDQNNN